MLTELNSIQSELSTLEKPATIEIPEKHVYSVEFRSETCKIRSSSNSYTFAELTTDAALYFNLIPEDCLLKDENGAIWPNSSKIIQEFDSLTNKLVLGLKFGRIERNPQASEIN